MKKNRLYCGDNLEILATMEKESVDLIYIDPPFNSLSINFFSVSSVFSVAKNEIHSLCGQTFFC